LEIGEELSRLLIKSASDNLREIRLGEMVAHCYGVKFSLETLDAFLLGSFVRLPLLAGGLVLGV
ncbi:11257_t:CDS:1, partial [Funneliformis mosseae]